MATDDDNNNYIWTRDSVLSSDEEWTRGIDYARDVLLLARTSERIAFLDEHLLHLVKSSDLSLSRCVGVFKLLTLTYPRYPDSPSRESVEKVLVEMIRRDEEASKEQKLGIAEQVVSWLSLEVKRVLKRGTSTSTIASSDLFVLSSWSSRFYHVCAKANQEFTTSSIYAPLVGCMALLLDALLDNSSSTRESVKHGALTRLRRALRATSGTLNDLLECLVKHSTTNSAPLSFVPLLGATIDVAIRLKPTSLTISPELKNKILNLYSNLMILSKSPVPKHISTSLHDFISTYITKDDFESNLLPTMEKSSLRSPEISLTVITQFFEAYSGELTEGAFKRVLTIISNCTKSSNPLVRNAAVDCGRTILSKHDTSTTMGDIAVPELLSLPKSGKTTGPEHRLALFTILLSVAPSVASSPAITSTLLPLILKETNDHALTVLAALIPRHITYILRSQLPLPNEVGSVLVKETANAKAVVKKTFWTILGRSVWDEPEMAEKSGLVDKILTALEAGLKTPGAGGYYEAYIALALLLGPLSKSDKSDAIIKRNPSIQAIVPAASASKQAFLLSEKVYSKVVDPEEETWLLRACHAAAAYFENELQKNATFQTMFGSLYVHLAVYPKTTAIRKATVVLLEESMKRTPELTASIIRAGLRAQLMANVAAAASKGAEATITTTNVQPRLATFAQVCGAVDEAVDIRVREGLVADVLVLAHHPSICGPMRQTWISLCQRAKVDPYALINDRLDDLLKLVIESTTEYVALMEASYSAVTTLVFVSPETVLPRLFEQVNQDLDSAALDELDETDMGIWLTPEGTPFVDVLAQGKKEMSNKGKGAALSKWDEEVRKSIASKKAAGAVTLSKQEQALVNAQLEKEAKRRERIREVKRQIERGLALVRAIVGSGVDGIGGFMYRLSTLLVQRSLGGKALVLVGSDALDTYVALAGSCSERLGTLRKWIGVATARTLKPECVPEDLQAEPLGSLVLRLLYRLRTLSEQAPFEVATFAYAYTLLGQVFLLGGVGVGEEEDPLEQITLALDVVNFHSGEFSQIAFPRAEAMSNLLHVNRLQPQLSKLASTTLISVGEAVASSTVSQNELDVLLQALLTQESHVRNSCLQALQPFDLTDLDWSPPLWVACHDEDEQNARLAQRVWEDNGLDVPENYLPALLGYLGHSNAYVRSSVAPSIAEAVEHYPQSVSATVSTLQEYYRDKAKILAPEFDEYGMVIATSLDRQDPWMARVAVAGTLRHLAPFFSANDVLPFFSFLINDEALGDREGEVRRSMLQAGTAVVDLHGKQHLGPLISTFEAHLARPSAGTETSDHIQEGVVILFGRLARHLDASDSRIPAIVDRLTTALKTPSEQVQIAVSECISPLVTIMGDQVPKMIDNLIEDLLNGPKYAIRRGAAYGLAGVIRGSGIGSMKKFGIISRLKAATEDKKRYEPRQGTMFAFETLSNALGRLFEPWIPHILPLLLACFGDATTDVREATQDAARVIMSNMSGYGVKLILPSLLSGLDEKQWRTKKGSIELLGMMAYCSPRQLSLSLPIVIPRLTEVLTDSHAQVKASANKSLKQFGEVISNPEIQKLVPILLKALVDPAKTPNALASLLKTSFLHYIDHSSLAIVIPILDRGLRERSADTKKKAAQIVGNLASLTDSKDFVPYLDQLLPLVHVVLVDPVPEARATAAKALGTLVERLGEIHFPDLVPGLLRTLKTSTAAVDRQGAAQGLSEVLSGLGMERLEGLLPDIISNAQSPRSNVKEGFMSLLVYLPATFGTRFTPHLPKTIAPILGGLADTEEFVREAAMRAGRMIVNNYSSKAIDLLLPELEQGLFDSGWRIRQSSVTLVGELLFKITGITVRADVDDEGEENAEAGESSKRALIEVLGLERRDRILSALYLVRQDGVVVVRQASIHIWKALVNNTPRTVREILPELLSQIIFLVSGEEAEQQETASRTTTELCRKFGERIIGEIMKILREKAQSTDPRTREGVCLTISDIMESSTDTQLEDHEEEIITIVRASLVDDEANVRSAAARAFDVLQETIGVKAIDLTIPTLLEALRQPGQGSGTALQALREVMSVRASTVFPVLIPTLTAIPMTVFNAKALASLVTVAGNALSRRLTVILGALVKVLEEESEGELRDAVDEAIHASLESIDDAEGLNTLMLTLLGWAKHDSAKRRASAFKLFGIFCEVSEIDASLYRIDWVRQLVSSMDDPVEQVYQEAWNALDAFVKSVPKDELEPLVVPLRRTIETTGAPGQDIPGFSLPKGLSPFVPVIIAGLTTGTNEQREQAAYAIGDLVERTSEAGIKPFVVPFTGPLIRVATQSTTYPPAVKTAILSALKSMLEHIPAFVKPFFPQLQRTFVKSTSDPSSAVVRTKAAEALGVLMKSQPRVDPVIAELVTGAKGNEDSIATSFALALSKVVRNASVNMGAAAVEACVELVSDIFRESHEEQFIQAVAALFASLSPFHTQLEPIVKSHLVAGTPLSAASSHLIRAVVSPDEDEDDSSGEQNVFQKLGLFKSVAQKALESAGSDKPNIGRPAREARDALKQSSDEEILALF